MGKIIYPDMIRNLPQIAVGDFVGVECQLVQGPQNQGASSSSTPPSALANTLTDHSRAW